MIFFIRFITATCLFAFLGKANVWLNSSSNVILAVGYRLFLILSPLIANKTGKCALPVSLFIATFGTLLFCSNSDYLMLFGAIMVGIGLSVSGYLIKSEVSETPTGAAHNKIALNIGSLLSGVIILFFLGPKSLFFSIAAILLLISGFISFGNSLKTHKVQFTMPKYFTKKKGIGWTLMGIGIGIKLFGVFSVLPQYFINQLSHLPNWYGVMIFINSIVIILFQLPIINLIDKFNNFSLKITVIALLIGMILIAFPQIFSAETFFGALIWTILLSIIECCASYLDVHASRAGYLLIKEMSIGLGAGLTVLMGRYLDHSFSGISIGILGISVILGACILLYDDLKNISLGNS